MDSEEGIVAGNLYDKVHSRNPIARRLVEGFDRSLAALLDRVGAPARVLELGCGEGNVTASLARRFPGARVLGTDLSPRILETARREHAGLEFRERSIYDAAADGPWDLVVACEVFEHLEDPARALDAVARAAGGHVILTVPREPLWRVLNFAAGRYWRRLGNTPGHLQHWSRRAFERFVAARLEVLELRTPTPWIQVLARRRPE